MREIKFRTFVKGSKKMIYGRGAMSVRTFTPNYRWYASEVEVMQYTGVKDDGGNEIYEGDIVRVSCALITLQSIDIEGEVKMLEGGWVIDSGYTLRNLWSEVHNVQIIGNIYEGPRK